MHRSYSDVLFSPDERRPYTRNAGDINYKLVALQKVTLKYFFLIQFIYYTKKCVYGSCLGLVAPVGM